MKILFFSRSAMNDMYSFGNTVMNLFQKTADDRFYHFYIRKQLPKNSIIDEYYNISSIDSIKRLLGRKRKCRFTPEEIQGMTDSWGKSQGSEQRIIANSRKKKNKLLYFIEEMIWLSKIWLNNDFKRFVADAEPDIFFAFAANSFLLKPLLCYIKKHTNAKIVLFIADDVSEAYKKEGFFRGGYLSRAFDKSIAMADKLYGISQEMCDKYEKQYNKPVSFLCKGCDFARELHSNANSPLKFVYAGNILYGREATLIKLAQLIKEFNENGQRAVLEIYTASSVSDSVSRQLNIENTSYIMGSRPYAEIQEIVNKADVLLHVESFEQEQIDLVKYSFSTKITDCLQSGTAVMAIGPSGIASIEYLKKADGVIVAESYEDMAEKLGMILSDSGLLLDNAVKIREFAQERLSIDKVRGRLRGELENLK